MHVYSNFTFIERIVLDGYITKCIYLFIIFYLKLTYITACLLKQKESEQKGECGSDYSKLISLVKTFPFIGYIYLFVVVSVSLFFGSMFIIMCKKRQGSSCLVTLKRKKK